MVRENFTAWTEQDTGGYLSQTATRATETNVPRNVNAWLYKNFGANHFSGDFDAIFDLKVTAITTSATRQLRGIIAAFTETPGAYDDLSPDRGEITNTKVAVWNPNLDNKYYLVLHASVVDADEGTDTGGNMDVGTTYYCRYERVSDVLNFEVYSTAAKRVAGGDGDIAHLTLPGITIISYDYAEVTASAGTEFQNDKFISAYVENLYVQYPGTPVTLFSKTEIRSSNSQTLFSKFEIRHSSSSMLFGKFNVPYSGSSNLFAETEIRNSDSINLFSEVCIGSFASQALFAELEIRHTGICTLPSETEIRHSNSQNLSAEFNVRISSYQNLFAELSVYQTHFTFGHIASDGHGAGGDRVSYHSYASGDIGRLDSMRMKFYNANGQNFKLGVYTSGRAFVAETQESSVSGSGIVTTDWINFIGSQRKFIEDTNYNLAVLLEGGEIMYDGNPAANLRYVSRTYEDGFPATVGTGTKISAYLSIECKCEYGYNGSQNLKAVFQVTSRKDLFAKFEVGQDSADLSAEFEIRRPASVDFFSKFKVIYKFENFEDNYTESDVPGRLTQNETRSSFLNLARQDDAVYLYRNFGVAWFDYFIHLFEFNLSNVDSDGGDIVGFLLTLSNDLDDWEGIKANLSAALGLAVKTYNYNYNLQLRESYLGADSSIDLDNAYDILTTYYGKLEKFGNKATIYIYSDSGRTVLIESKSLTLGANLLFDYLMVPQSLDGGAANPTMSGYVDYYEIIPFRHLLNEFQVRHTSWQNLFGEAKITHPGSADLFAKFEVGQDSSELLAEADIQHSSSAVLFTDFKVRHSGTDALFAEFDIQRVGSAELFGKTEIGHEASVGLFGKIRIRHDSSVAFFADFIIRHTGISLDLFAEGEIQHSASATLFNELEVRNTGSLNLFAEITIRHKWSGQLHSEFIVRHSSSLSAPFCKAVIRQSGSQGLFNKLVVKNVGTLDLLSELQVRHSASTQIKGWGIVQFPYENVFAETRIRHSNYKWLKAEADIKNPKITLFAKFEVKHFASVNLKGVFILRQGVRDLFCDFHVGQGASDLKNFFHVGQDHEYLQAEFLLRQETINLFAHLSVTHSRDLFSKLEIDHVLDLLGKFHVGQNSLNLKGFLKLTREDLPAEFFLRNAGITNLKSLIDIRHEASSNLKAVVQVQKLSGSQNLLAEFEVLQGIADLLCKTKIRPIAKNVPASIAGDWISDWVNFVVPMGNGFIAPPVMTDDSILKKSGLNCLKLESMYERGQYEAVRFGWVREEEWALKIVRQQGFNDLPAYFYVMSDILPKSSWADPSNAAAWWDQSVFSGVYTSIKPTDDYLEVCCLNPAATRQLVGAYVSFGTYKKYQEGTWVFDAQMVDKQSTIGAEEGCFVLLGCLCDARVAGIFSDSYVGLLYDPDDDLFKAISCKNGTETKSTIAAYDPTDRHTYKMQLEGPSTFPPNGRFRVWVDDVLSATIVSNIPLDKSPKPWMSFLVQITATYIDAGERPGVRLYSWSDA